MKIKTLKSIDEKREIHNLLQLFYKEQEALFLETHYGSKKRLIAFLIKKPTNDFSNIEIKTEGDYNFKIGQSIVITSSYKHVLFKCEIISNKQGHLTVNLKSKLYYRDMRELNRQELPLNHATLKGTKLHFSKESIKKIKREYNREIIDFSHSGIGVVISTLEHDVFELGDKIKLFLSDQIINQVGQYEYGIIKHLSHTTNKKQEIMVRVWIEFKKPSQETNNLSYCA